jgi:hypothetical protein
MAASGMLSRCGIYCGACYVYRAMRDGGEFLKDTAERQGVAIDEVSCMGCMGPEEALWVNCAKCRVRGCLKEKGLGFCYQCREFQERSCVIYERLTEFCAKRGEDTRGAMTEMEKDPDAWLKAQDEKWRCGSCGGPYSWYEETCHHCGSDLERTDLRT